MTPLMLASSGLFLIGVLNRLAEGEDPTVQNLFGQTALHLVADFGYTNEELATEIIELLLAHGANINAQDHDGVTPLMLAAYRRSRIIVAYLLSHGADANLRNDDGDTILGTIIASPALFRRSRRIIRLLEAAGAVI